MAKVIKRVEKTLGNTLESFYILPVQRVPRYVLLLKVLIEDLNNGPITEGFGIQ